ncbi:DUF2290 domain-containing protein [Litoribacter ruber]|uniref:DUF2290 domain-containing protein n=1 Tax=Litoribacter ruber TaxID=702568 RepID=UPI001BDB3E93|nr:DUF2290 domain-containing protein [Litoribacter ruber]MBT0812977.1 DUF2290 domain-containing protein [Litoribacter ruber]
MDIDKIKELLDQIKTVFKDIILSTNYEKISENILSWPNYKPGIFKNIYSKEYEFIVKNRQYSFLLKDNLGCIQFFYEFNNGEVLKIKMAYYPYPVVLNENVTEVESFLDESYDETLLEYYYDIWEIFNHEFELNINDKDLKEIFLKSQSLGNNESFENLLMARFDFKYKLTNSSHIRIDFDSRVSSHNKCEIQVGAVNEIRVPINKIISPIIFFDFIVKNILKGTDFYENLSRKSNYVSMFKYHRSIKSEIDDFNESNIYIV